MPDAPSKPGEPMLDVRDLVVRYGPFLACDADQA